MAQAHVGGATGAPLEEPCGRFRLTVHFVSSNHRDVRIARESGVPFVGRSSIAERRCSMGRQRSNRERVLRGMPARSTDPTAPKKLPPDRRVDERGCRDVQRQHRNGPIAKALQTAQSHAVGGHLPSVAWEAKVRNHQPRKRTPAAPATQLLVDIINDDDRGAQTGSVQPAADNVRRSRERMPRVGVPAVAGQDDDVVAFIAQGHVGTVQWIALSDQYG